MSAVAAAALGGCATSLAPEAPAGVDLAGPWKLDHGASDDPQKLLTKMRTEAFHLMGQRQAMPVVRPGQGRQELPIPAPGQEDYSPDAHGHRPDPLLRSPMARVILTSVARGDYLAIRQREGEVVFDYGVARRSFTPGAHSVVSTVDGSVGDQTSGWKGREYLIVQKGGDGPRGDRARRAVRGWPAAHRQSCTSGPPSCRRWTSRAYTTAPTRRRRASCR